MKALVLGWYQDMAQEGGLASVFDSIPMFQPQSYAIMEWTTENTDTGYQKRDHRYSINQAAIKPLVNYPSNSILDLTATSFQ
jgi:hypothetical protein